MLHITLFSAIFTVAIAVNMDVIYEWKYIDYIWESQLQKYAYIASGQYNYTQIYTIDVDTSEDGRVFVTTPRHDGVPASLSTISDISGDGGPLLAPYPNWSWWKKGDCNGITSVYRVALDKCNRMWVLDTGKNGDDQICPAQLLAFNLFDDSLLYRVKIPFYISHNPKNTTNGLLVTPAVETGGNNCERTQVYMADVEGRGLIVWNGREIWRLDNAIFYPDEAAEIFTIAGESFFLDDGILSLAITPCGQRCDKRYLHFSALSAFREFMVPLDDLRRPPANEGDIRYYEYDYKLPSQAAAHAFTKSGIMFFGLATETAIACWNRRKTMNADNVVIVAQDEETLQFSSGVKVIPRRKWLNCNEELWVSTNRLQKIYLGNQNFNEVNYRILKAPVSVLIEETNCEL